MRSHLVPFLLLATSGGSLIFGATADAAGESSSAGVGPERTWSPSSKEAQAAAQSALQDRVDRLSNVGAPYTPDGQDQQHVLTSPNSPESLLAPRPPSRLTGRFLHVTDFHPDPHYKTGSSISEGCHRLSKDDEKKRKRRKKKKKRKKRKGGKGKSMDLSESDLDEEEEDESEWEGDLDDIADDADLSLDSLGGASGGHGAGYWGSAVSDCDAPLTLVNSTFDWLSREWADSVDFVVWTGDNARHDIDRDIPRTPQEIYTLNRYMVDKMQETFGKKIVLVPSIGNNDIYPHNILAPGPNAVTSSFADIWSEFIPPEQYHIFQRGAYYSVEVIPDKLAVISLNTLFWYDTNKAVDGCRSGSSEPGALEFDWLEVQLDAFRDRGVQVWLTGHVPPHRGRYFDNCYLRYGNLALRYQDTIVGHLYGHMNVDHFFFLDVDELEHTEVDSFMRREADAKEEMEIEGRSSATSLQKELLEDFEKMPHIDKIKMEDYVVINVAPSVIPTYLPAVRVFSYNITEPEGVALEERGREHEHEHEGSMAGGEEDEEDEDEDEEVISEVEPQESTPRKYLWNALRYILPNLRDFAASSITFAGNGHGKTQKQKQRKRKKSKKSCSRPENEDKPHCVFKRKPRYNSPISPSRSNRYLSPLGFVQFYLPNLTGSGENGKEAPKWEIEYTTYPKEALFRGVKGDVTEDPTSPVPLHLLPGFEKYSHIVNGDGGNGSATELTVSDDEKEAALNEWKETLNQITPFDMPDLTIKSWVKFAQRLAKDKSLWKRFASTM